MFGFKKKEPYKQEVENYLKQVGGINKAYDINFHAENFEDYLQGFELAVGLSAGFLVENKDMDTIDEAIEFLKYMPSRTEDNIQKNQLFNQAISFTVMQLLKDGMNSGPYTLGVCPQLADLDRYDPKRISFVAGINALTIMGALYHADNSSVTPMLDELLDGGMSIKDRFIQNAISKYNKVQESITWAKQNNLV